MNKRDAKKLVESGNLTVGEFDDFYNRAIEFLITNVIPGLDRAELERELMEFV